MTSLAPLSFQLIAELQTSVCDSKEEAVRLQKAMERQLEEAHARWDEERKTLHHHADQSNKVGQVERHNQVYSRHFVYRAARTKPHLCLDSGLMTGQS